jgi:hypothetical protein
MTTPQASPNRAGRGTKVGWRRARMARLTSARGVGCGGHLGERGVEHDAGAVLEQRDGDAAHAGARGHGGLDGAGAGGARHARDPDVRLRALLLPVVRRRRRRAHLHVVRVQQRHVLHVVSRRPRPAAGDRRELQVGHVRQTEEGGREEGGRRDERGGRESWLLSTYKLGKHATIPFPSDGRDGGTNGTVFLSK